MEGAFISIFKDQHGSSCDAKDSIILTCFMLVSCQPAHCQELQAASVDPQQLEQQAGRGHFRRLDGGSKRTCHWNHKCILFGVGLFGFAKTQTPGFYWLCTGHLRSFRQKACLEAQAAEHAVQHLGEQRDDLRGQLQSCSVKPVLFQHHVCG